MVSVPKAARRERHNTRSRRGRRRKPCAGCANSEMTSDDPGVGDRGTERPVGQSPIMQRERGTRQPRSRSANTCHLPKGVCLVELSRAVRSASRPPRAAAIIPAPTAKPAILSPARAKELPNSSAISCSSPASETMAAAVRDMLGVRRRFRPRAGLRERARGHAIRCPKSPPLPLRMSLH